MVSQNYATVPRILTFYGETATDLSLMPTTTKVGEGRYSIVGLAPAGSIAQILTDDGLQYYMLRSTGWVEINAEDLDF